VLAQQIAHYVSSLEEPPNNRLKLAARGRSVAE